jgi:hypothetical protein
MGSLLADPHLSLTGGPGLLCLVQPVVRDRQGEEGRSCWTTAVMTPVSAVVPADSDDVASWGAARSATFRPGRGRPRRDGRRGT